MKISDHLIDDARSAWRFVSVQSMGVSMAIIGAWAAMPDEWRSVLSPGETKALLIVVLGLGIVGRMIKQPAKGGEHVDTQ